MRFVRVWSRKQLLIRIGICLAVIFVLRMGSTAVVSSQKRKLPVYSVDRQEQVVALGINCAWDADDLPEILAALEQEQVKATFFLVGQWAEQFPEAAASIVQAGHEVGNHSYSHKDFAKAEDRTVREEILRCNDLVEKLTGVRPELVRAPSGSYTSRTVEIIEEMGLYAIQWDVDSLDWKKISAEEIVKNCTKSVQKGSILLLHCGAPHTAEALPEVIRKLKEMGYGFSTVGEMIYRENCEFDHTGRQLAPG